MLHSGSGWTFELWMTESRVPSWRALLGPAGYLKLTADLPQSCCPCMRGAAWQSPIRSMIQLKVGNEVAMLQRKGSFVWQPGGAGLMGVHFLGVRSGLTPSLSSNLPSFNPGSLWFYVFHGELLWCPFCWKARQKQHAEILREFGRVRWQWPVIDQLLGQRSYQYDYSLVAARVQGSGCLRIVGSQGRRNYNCIDLSAQCG